MTKTVTAKEFARNPRNVYRHADKKGDVKINHSDYPDCIFVLTCRERRAPDDK